MTISSLSSDMLVGWRVDLISYELFVEGSRLISHSYMRFILPSACLSVCFLICVFWFGFCFEKEIVLWEKTRKMEKGSHKKCLMH